MREYEILVSNETRRLSRMGLGWRWRILSSDETSKLISFGGGVGENFLTRNLVVSHEPRLPKKDSAVRVERVLCFHFPCLSDHMSIMF